MVPGRQSRGYGLLNGHHHHVTIARGGPDLRLQRHLGDSRLHNHPLFSQVVSGGWWRWRYRTHYLGGHDQPAPSILGQQLDVWRLGAGFRRRIVRTQRHTLQGREAEHTDVGVAAKNT
jgi:hypothetical protein